MHKIIRRLISFYRRSFWSICSTIFLVSIAILSANNQRLNRILNFHPKYLDRHFQGYDDRPTVSMRAKYASTYRPRVYAFYNSNKDLDYHLISAWQEAWNDAGWHPVVKSIEDAKKHELYNEFQNVFDSTMHLQHIDRKKDYLKWLAMIVNGGGWVADLATFPLNVHPTDGRILPNGGNFTVYSDVDPCLISGSAREWNRITRVLLDKYKALSQGVARQPEKSMMVSIQQPNVKVYDLVPKVAELDIVYSKELSMSGGQNIALPNFDYEKCIFLEDKNAIHFERTIALRLNFNRLHARQWLHDWKKQCIIS